MVQLTVERIEPPEGVNIIIGQSHFIKTVEDIYETLVASSPTIQFGVAFCESSGPAVVRYDGNDEEMANLAMEYADSLAAGHVFVVLLRNAFPINVLNRLKRVDEVATIFCATANPLEVVLAETDQGRGILGVVDGVKTKGVEDLKSREERHAFLRKIGYKR